MEYELYLFCNIASVSIVCLIGIYHLIGKIKYNKINSGVPKKE